MTEGWDTGACVMTVGCRLGTVTICVWVGTSGVVDVAAVSRAGGLAGCRGVIGSGWSASWFWGGLCWMGMCWVIKEVVVVVLVVGAGVGVRVGLCVGVTVFSGSGLVG